MKKIYEDETYVVGKQVLETGVTTFDLYQKTEDEFGNAYFDHSAIVPNPVGLILETLVRSNDAYKNAVISAEIAVETAQGESK